MSDFDLGETTTVAAKKSVFAKIAALSAKTKIATAAGLVVLLGGGGAFAYTTLNTPDAIVGLAIAGAFSGSHPSFEISADINSGGSGGTGTLDVYTADAGSLLSLKAAAKLNGMPIGATLNVVSSKAGDVYANLSDFDSLGAYLVMAGLVPEATVTSARTALTDTWVKVSKAEVEQYSAAATSGAGSDCITSKLNNPDYTKKVQDELTSAIRNNNFIGVTKELPQVNGDRVFVLGIKADQLRAFLTAVKNTTYYQDVHTCLPMVNISEADIAGITQSKIDNEFNNGPVTLTTTLYANSFSHNLDKIEFAVYNSDSNEHSLVTFKPLGDQSSKVVIPVKSVSVTELLSTLTSPTY
ncbi:MAG: hypothetical protein RJA35_135 [Actinomycetota bacterium]|jgi:hypothetical protein